MTKCDVQIVYLPNYVGGEKLGYKHEGDSGMDLRAGIPSTVTLYPNEIKIIPSGVKMASPIGTEIQVRPRGGTSLKGLTIVNTPGTVDSNYRGEIGILVHNVSDTNITIQPGDRIAQAVVCPVYKANLIEVTDLGDTTRGEGAYNSTGVK